MKALLTIFSILYCSVHGLAQYGYDTVKIHFPINITSLDEASKRCLDSLAKVAANRSMLVYGYADYLGNEPANMELAINRSNNVREYLLAQKVPAQQIIICEGIGQVNRNVERQKEGYPEDRRVEIFLKRSIPPRAGKMVPVKQAGSKKMKVAEYTQEGSLVPMTVLEKKPDPPPAPKADPPVQKPAQRPKINLANNEFEKLSEMQPNEILRIESIHFQATRHFITPDSEPILIALLTTLLNHPNIAVRIEGHVCCMKGNGDAFDTDTYELKLSVNRAQYIYQYLIQNGVDAKRLEFIGFGKSRPIVPVELTEDDAQRNRRVEIRVLRN